MNHEKRPWGEFFILHETDNFKVKRIVVNSKQRISYQSHAKREEHWVVVAGHGYVTLNDEKIAVEKGNYVKIPVTCKHRIECTSTEPLEFIEVQLGEYFGEDDIVRYQDDYRRKS